MADVWEIARYVESHPENVEQRWRLAKKFYLAWEYRHALEHLQILKNDWPDKQNVRRYLAATYYRLKRYGDAAAELRQAIEKWPEEIGLREQLARTLDVSGAPSEAADVWEVIARMDPDHQFAKRAVRILRERAHKDPAKQPLILSMDTPRYGEVAAEIPCPECGARNGYEFTRCWQCNSPLGSDPHRLAARAAAAEAQSPAPPKRIHQREGSAWPLALGIGALALLGVSLYLTLRHGMAGAAAGALPYEDLNGAIAAKLIVTRVVTGLALVISWPLAIWLALEIARIEENVEGAMMTGVFLGALSFALSWIPASAIVLAPIAVACAAAACCYGVLGLRGGDIARVWGVQLAFLALVPLTCFAALHGFRFVRELPAFIGLAAQNPRVTSFDRGLIAPAGIALEWDPIPSKWIAENATDTQFRFDLGGTGAPVTVTLENAHGETVFFREVSGPSTTIPVDRIEPGLRYNLTIGAERSAAAGLRIESLWRVREIETPAPPLPAATPPSSGNEGG